MFHRPLARAGALVTLLASSRGAAFMVACGDSQPIARPPQSSAPQVTTAPSTTFPLTPTAAPSGIIEITFAGGQSAPDLSSTR